MHRHVHLTLGLALLASFAVAVPHDAEAKRPRPKRARAQSYCVSTMYSGALSGEILVNGVSCQVSPTATIYEIGRGALLVGTPVRDRMICVSGTKRGDLVVIHSISVRPLVSASSLMSDGSGSVKLNQSERPQ
jgi:hypothetical protein